MNQTPQGAALSDADIARLLFRRLPALRGALNERNYPVNEDDFKEYAAVILAAVLDILAADRRLTAEQPTGKFWCETCEGTGKVHQEHQKGCHVGGEFPCPDCDGNGWWQRARAPVTAEQGGAERCPSGKCADPASDCFGSGCVVSGSPAASDVETIIALKSSEQASLSPGAYQVLTNAVANTRLTTAPVCPHCGHVEHDAWEWTFGPGLEGERIGDCNSCGKEFRTYREVSVYYTTSRPAP